MTSPTPDLCRRCAHRRRAGGRRRAPFASDQPNSRPTAARLQAMREDVLAEETERAAVTRRTSPRLSVPPRDHDWCAARTRGDVYYFCAWLDDDSCRDFSPASGTTADTPASGRAAGPVLPTDPPPPAADATPVGVATATRVEWTASIGTALADPMRLENHPDGFEVEYALDRSTGTDLTLNGNALFQTCLLFGGPGAGKTHLFLRLLRQVLAHEARPGCLLLDPKGVLEAWLDRTLREIGREPALVISPRATVKPRCNIVDLPLRPAQVGKLMAEVVAAEAGGIDPGWTILISDLLESGAEVLAHGAGGSLTAARLVSGVLTKKRRTDANPAKRPWDYPVRAQAEYLLQCHEWGDRLDGDLLRACLRIVEYYEATKDEQRRFVRQAIEASFAELLREDWAWLSTDVQGPRLYEAVHNEGRVVLVSIGQGSAAFQRSLCTLMKAGYQQTVLAGLAAHRDEDTASGHSVLACDEYAQVATEGRSGLVSDSSFFSLSREAGCTALLALQSLATGRSRFEQAMRDRWEGILGNVGLRVFMRLNDMETAKLASEFAGRTKRIITLSSRSLATQGATLGESHQMLDVEVAPPTLFTNRLARGMAFVHGTVDTRLPNTATFVQVPS